MEETKAVSLELAYGTVDLKIDGSVYVSGWHQWL